MGPGCSGRRIDRGAERAHGDGPLVSRFCKKLERNAWSAEVELELVLPPRSPISFSNAEFRVAKVLEGVQSQSREGSPSENRPDSPRPDSPMGEIEVFDIMPLACRAADRVSATEPRFCRAGALGTEGA